MVVENRRGVLDESDRVGRCGRRVKLDRGIRGAAWMATRERRGSMSEGC